MIAHSECVLVALVIWHAKRMSDYIVICCLSGYTIFFHISHKWHDFREKKLLNIKCVCAGFFYSVALKHFTF
jgi:hypothetical protein